MIELGLGRISRLMKYTPQTWKAIHVAGTNGKGTICAYLSAMLAASGVRCGRFTSPHLMDRWDCITINEKTIQESVFQEVEELIKLRNTTDDIRASEFELLTAIAFEIFHREKIDMGVVEVGMGGRLDATNVLENKAVTVISKIGLDHQRILGDTIEEIALQKAGIIRPGVPCVMDSSNASAVQQVIQDQGREAGAAVIPSSTDASFFHHFSHEDLQPHQWNNLACAYTAFLLAYTKVESPLHRLIPAIQKIHWPGRLQFTSIRSVTTRTEDVLLDGAHNRQSAEVLGSYVDRKLRTGNNRVTWVIAASQGKDLVQMLQPLLRPEDCVASVAFGRVDGMPWVQATDPREILDAASTLGVGRSQQYDADRHVSGALRWASESAATGPLVIAGSLYLVSDIFRILRDAENMKAELFDT